MSDLRVCLGDEIPFRVFGFESSASCNLQSKERAFALTFAVAGAFYLMVRVIRDYLHIDLAAASDATKLIAHFVCLAINRQLAFQNRLHAETFVILPAL